MTDIAAAYMARKAEEDRAAAERSARVREFIAESDSDIISDLFAEIKDAVLTREVNEAAALAAFYKSILGILHDVEMEFCNY